jgi:hypothetical protein
VFGSGQMKWGGGNIFNKIYLVQFLEGKRRSRE